MRFYFTPKWSHIYPNYVRLDELLINNLQYLLQAAVYCTSRLRSDHFYNTLTGMQIGAGKITEIFSALDGCVSLRVDCSPKLVPGPGQYLLAYEEGDADAVLTVPLFRVGSASQPIFQGDTDLPAGWGPGTSLRLRGPLGKGFNIPADTRHLALAACGDTISRLFPLIDLIPDVDIAVFSNAPLADLPMEIEAHPLDALSETMGWADYLAIDLPLERLDTLRQILGLDAQQGLPCLAQVLILSSMPCGALAECGVCAVPARKGYKLACKDGPVFDLNQLKW
jgi:hypothetical protein